jgi:ferredoxin
MAKVNLEFADDIKKYGAKDFNACYNCGTCTAICDLSDADNSFPRKMIRYTTLGIEDEIKYSLDPWLCYYCGDCSQSCPRQADPGNLMMSLRRWLTSKYDWTGLSGLLYRYMAAYIIAFLLIIIGIVTVYMNGTFTQKEWLEYGHLFEMIAIGSVFAVILIPNIIRMWYFSVWKPTKKFKIKPHFSAISDLLVHMFTQKRSLDCDKERKDTLWYIEHLLLVLSYMALLFTTVFLDWFGTKSAIVNVFGYAVSTVIFIVTTDFVIRRIRKRSEKSKFSHPSDWFFVIWLLMMGISAFAVRLLIDAHVLENTFGVYLFHLIILVQWAVIIVPFGKWTHFLYRSFAMYFDKVKMLSNPVVKKK